MLMCIVCYITLYGGRPRRALRGGTEDTTASEGHICMYVYVYIYIYIYVYRERERCYYHSIIYYDSLHYIIAYDA